MRKTILILPIIALLIFSGCTKGGAGKRIKYSVQLLALSDPLATKTTLVTYLDENGETQFYDLRKLGGYWGYSGDFIVGDRVSLAVNTPVERGTVTLTIECQDCGNMSLDNGKMIRTIDLSVTKNGEISFNLE